MKMVTETTFESLGVRVERIAAATDGRYANFVMRHPEATVYHHPAWRKTIEKTFRRMEPHDLCFLDSRNALVGVLPGIVSQGLFSDRAFKSLPLASYGDPLCNSAEIAGVFLDALLQSLRERRFGSIELKLLKACRSADGLGFHSMDCFVTHILRLDRDLEDIRRSLHKTSIQQRLRQAQKFGLKLALASDEGMGTFHHLHALSRRSIGLPPIPRSFFENLRDACSPNGLLKLLVVTYLGKPISAMIMLQFNGRAHAEYIATDPTYLYLHPDQFITWEAISMAHEQGCTEFDFGRSSLDNTGLINYKARWGAEEQQLHYYSFPGTSIAAVGPDSLKLRLTKAVCRRMPLSALRFTGNIFYQQFY
jgi:hypothetical protein